MLEAIDISVIRSGRPILDQVSIRLQTGRVSVILGPNGAGKSTLLRVLSGTLLPESGDVRLDDRPLASFPPRELARRRGVLAQQSFLQFDYSVSEVVILGRIPHLSGWESEADHDAARRALAAVGLESLAHRRYPTLSGGEKQRVHLARVLAQLDVFPGRPAKHEADTPTCWLLLDEPTSALDLRHQHAVLAHAHQLARATGLGVCAVLHDINLALRYADHITLLDQGCLAAAGPTREALTPEAVSTVYGVEAELHHLNSDSCPFMQIHPTTTLTCHV